MCVLQRATPPTTITFASYLSAQLAGPQSYDTTLSFDPNLNSLSFFPSCRMAFTQAARIGWVLQG